jgi:hypothetical protein
VHNGPRHPQPNRERGQPLFVPGVEVLVAAETEFSGEIETKDGRARRTVSFTRDGVSLVDEVAWSNPQPRFTLGPTVAVDLQGPQARLTFPTGAMVVEGEDGEWRQEPGEISEGYGRVDVCVVLHWTHHGP